MNKQVGLELAALRTRTGKNLKEVAKDLKINPSTLSRYENAEINLTIEIIEKLLNYYNVSPVIFFETVCAYMDKKGD